MIVSLKSHCFGVESGSRGVGRCQKRRIKRRRNDIVTSSKSTSNKRPFLRKPNLTYPEQKDWHAIQIPVTRQPSEWIVFCSQWDRDPWMEWKWMGLWTVSFFLFFFFFFLFLSYFFPFFVPVRCANSVLPVAKVTERVCVSGIDTDREFDRAFDWCMAWRARKFRKLLISDKPISLSRSRDKR